MQLVRQAARPYVPGRPGQFSVIVYRCPACHSSLLSIFCNGRHGVFLLCHFLAGSMHKTLTTPNPSEQVVFLNDAYEKKAIGVRRRWLNKISAQIVLQSFQILALFVSAGRYLLVVSDEDEVLAFFAQCRDGVSLQNLCSFLHDHDARTDTLQNAPELGCPRRRHADNLMDAALNMKLQPTDVKCILAEATEREETAKFGFSER